MPKYITQEMFNVCVITAAKYAHGNSKNYHEAGQLVAESYEREYADENLASYIALEAEQTVKHITEKLPPNNLVATCYQLQFCVKEFNNNGERKKKIFDVTFFDNEKSQIPDKPGSWSSQLNSYSLSVLLGRIPLPPDNWSLN